MNMISKCILILGFSKKVKLIKSSQLVLLLDYLKDSLDVLFASHLHFN